MTSPAVSAQCEGCQHFRGFKKGLKFPVCTAYSKGIPIEISMGEHDHRKPFKGDKGIRFKPIK